MTVTVAGTRERQKNDRRRRIIAAAWAMFAEHGFEQVTMAQIADRAGVATRTVFNYFARKEDIVFQRTDTVLALFAEALRGRGPGTRLSDAVRDNALEMVEFDPDVPQEFSVAALLVANSATLQKRRLELLDAHARIIRDILVEQDGSMERGGLAYGLGYALAAVHWAAMEARGAAMAEGTDEAEAKAAAVEAITRGYDLLQSGLIGVD